MDYNIGARVSVPVIAYNVKTREERSYPSMLSCAIDLNLQVSHVSECCNGIREMHKGHTFRRLKK